MEALGTVIKQLKINGETYPVSEISNEEWAQKQAERMNSMPGTLTGTDCPKCLNRGYIWLVKGGQTVTRECECMKQRKSVKRIERSGLSNLLTDCTFERYKTAEKWQAEIKDAAEAFVEDSGKWFYIGGNSGSGKTHICTAICGELLKRNHDVRYMVWTTDIRRLKTLSNDEGYDKLFYQFADAEILYIDDLFKVKQGAELSPADIQRTYELINYRHINKAVTLISSEKTVQELLDIDEATGSRIYSMAKEYTFGVAGEKNYRLRG